jgi:hypothetical protein
MVCLCSPNRLRNPAELLPRSSMRRAVPSGEARSLRIADGRGRVAYSGRRPDGPRSSYADWLIYMTGLNDRSATRAASSNCASIFRFTPRRPSATFRAHFTYSILRLTDQSEGGLAASARRLLVLSASFNTLAFALFPGAVSTCLHFRVALGTLLSSVTSATREATNPAPRGRLRCTGHRPPSP